VTSTNSSHLPGEYNIVTLRYDSSIACRLIGMYECPQTLRYLISSIRFVSLIIQRVDPDLRQIGVAARSEKINRSGNTSIMALLSCDKIMDPWNVYMYVCIYVFIRLFVEDLRKL
jgi:hypothetical protein